MRGPGGPRCMRRCASHEVLDTGTARGLCSILRTEIATAGWPVTRRPGAESAARIAPRGRAQNHPAAVSALR